MRLCVCVCARTCVHVYVCVHEGNRVFARTALVVQMSVYLTPYSNFLSGVGEPLSRPSRCHTGLEHVQRE